MVLAKVRPTTAVGTDPRAMSNRRRVGSDQFAGVIRQAAMSDTVERAITNQSRQK